MATGKSLGGPRGAAARSTGTAEAGWAVLLRDSESRVRARRAALRVGGEAGHPGKLRSSWVDHDSGSRDRNGRSAAAGPEGGAAGRAWGGWPREPRSESGFRHLRSFLEISASHLNFL